MGPDARELDLRQLRDELRQEIRTGHAETRRHVDTVAEGLHQEILAGDAETRRHFHVIAESLVSKIELVAEGLSGLDQKVERLRGDMQDGFAQVDRRFVHLEARIMVLERR